MKSTTLFLVSLVIFVFTSPSISTSILTADDDLVLDFEGNPLEKDVGYVISLPGSRALGGTVVLAPPLETDETCEADVILVRVRPVTGTPFTFSPANGTEDVIKLGSPLAIQSPTQNPCGDSTVWKVTSREGQVADIITTGGIINTGGSCFRISIPEIQSLPNTYMFEYCPYLCGGAKICWPVGTTRNQSGFEDHLSINGASPFTFRLFKRSESTVDDKI